MNGSNYYHNYAIVLFIFVSIDDIASAYSLIFDVLSDFSKKFIISCNSTQDAINLFRTINVF